MPTRNNITWTDHQNAELRKAVKNFNAKITRLEKKYPNKKGALPERVTVKHLKEIVTTRHDLKREIETLKRFSRKGAETIVTPPAEYGNTSLELTKWELQEMLRKTKRVNIERAKKRAEIEEIEMRSRGQALGYKRGDVGMGDQDKALLEPIEPFTPTMNNTERKRKFRTLRKEYQIDYWKKRDDVVKEAYIKGLEQNYNPEDIKPIVDKIRGMSSEDFREIFESEGGTKTFEWVYPKKGRKVDTKGHRTQRAVDSTDKEYQDYLNALNLTWGCTRMG